MQYLETGSEPSPIDCFKKFHTKKDGKEWATDHAKTLYVGNLYQNFNFVNNFSFVGKFRPRLIELTSFKLKLLIRFIRNKTCKNKQTNINIMSKSCSGKVDITRKTNETN